MPAESKDELLAVTAKEYDKLRRLIDDLDETVAMPTDEDDTSVKDVVGHRAHWIGLFLGWYHDGQQGVEVHFPAEGYKWNELKRYNAELRAAQSELSWDDVRSDLADAHDRLVAFIDARSNNELYGGPMKGANNDWTTGRWAEAAGPSHYRSAAKYVRSRLRALAG